MTHPRPLTSSILVYIQLDLQSSFAYNDPGKVLQRRTHSANRFGRVTERIQGNQTLARARERASACDKVAEGGVREREANLMRMRGNLVGVSDKGASRRVGQAAVQPGLTRVERASKIGAEI